MTHQTHSKPTSTSSWAAGLLLAGLLLLSGSGMAALYKWVNAEGVTTYSQTPPDNGDRAQRLAPPPPPATPPGQAQRQLEHLQQQLADEQENRQVQADKAARQATEKAQTEQACARARRNLQLVQDNPHARFKTPDGNYRRYTGKERTRQIQQFKSFIGSHCN